MEGQTPAVNPLRAELDNLIRSPAYLDPFHAQNTQGRATAERLYAALYKDEGEDPATPEETEGLKAEVKDLEGEALKVDDPAAAKIQEDLKPLKAEWGSSYDANVQVAQGMTANLMKEYGIDAAEVFDAIGNHPLIVKNLYEWSQGRPGSELTPAEAREVIALLQKTDAYRSGFSRTSEKVREVMNIFYNVVYRL